MRETVSCLLQRGRRLPEPDREGGCLCGAVRYRVHAPLRDIVACHCGQCRRWHGHIGAYTAVVREALELTSGNELVWYRSSDRATRGFCRVCGSSLFWRGDGRAYVAIAAGSLDDASGLRLAEHIFVADRAPYDALDDGLPQHPHGLG